MTISLVTKNDGHTPEEFDGYPVRYSTVSEEYFIIDDDGNPLQVVRTEEGWEYANQQQS